MADIRTVIDRFRRYNWPGNVRELRNILERAVIIAGEGTIATQHLPRLRGARQGAVRRLDAWMWSERAAAGGHHRGRSGEGAHPAYARPHQNNKTRAAEILGISLKTLFNKLKEYGAAAEAEAGSSS